LTVKKLRKFVLCLQDENGGLATSVGAKADPNNGWLIKHLLNLGMKKVAFELREYLLKSQNADGGWGLNAKGPSTVSLTANALRGLCDVGVSPEHDAVQSAVRFLFAHQKKASGFSETVDTGVPWMKPGVIWGWITAVVVEALYGAGIRITTPAFDDAALYVRKCFWENRESIEGQSIMVRALRNTRFSVGIEMKEMKRRIDCLKQAENGGFPKDEPNLDTTLNALAFLYDVGVREDDARFRRAVEYVASSRNDDGGWPAAPGEGSVLWASLESAVLLKNLKRL
jgi:prenyltransferase beta subunit